MKTTSPIVAFAFACLVSACSSPPAGEPLDVAVIAGDWRGEGIELDISPDGTLRYENTRGTRTQISGAGITGVNTTGFDAGFFGLNTHFVINALPHEVDGVKTITIDGNVLQARRLTLAERATAAASAPPQPAPSADTVLPPTGTLASLVGLWIGGGTTLVIEPDGSLDYEHSGASTRTVLGAHVDTITATSFDLKLLGIPSTFAMSAPPAIVDGEVRMTIDGVVVTKQR